MSNRHNAKGGRSQKKAAKNRQHQTQPQQQKDESNLTSSAALVELTDKLLTLSSVPYQSVASRNFENIEDLQYVLEYVQTLEKDAETAVPPGRRCEADVLKRFADWLSENGAVFEGAKIEKFPEGGTRYELGLQATVDIPESSLVIAVPRNIMMTVDAAKQSELKDLLETDVVLKNMPNVALTMFLLLEKYKDNSLWAPYIETLPVEYSTILYFSIDDMRELQASPTLEGVLKQYKNITRQYAYFYRMIWASEDPACKILRKRYTFNEYRWAVSTVMTRQNTIPSDDGSHFINALIPLWDMCNHTSGTITTDYNPDLKRSECLALKNFKVGEQIFIFYGERSNAELFIHNGFVYEDNEHDGYCLYFGISNMDPLKDKRRTLLNKLAVPGHGEFWLTNKEVPINSELLAFLRVFNMNEEQLTQWIDDDKFGSLLDFGYIFEKAFEKKYWTFLLNRITLMLAHYKTSMEEDSKILSETATTDLSPKVVLAIKMRLSEKKILNNVRNYVQDKVDKLATAG